MLFTLDNSGSMAWGSITGTDANAEYTSPYDDAVRAGQFPLLQSMDGAKNKRAYYSPSYNKQYYDPAITYVPPVVPRRQRAGLPEASMGNSVPAAHASIPT